MSAAHRGSGGARSLWGLCECVLGSLSQEMLGNWKPGAPRGEAGEAWAAFLPPWGRRAEGTQDRGSFLTESWSWTPSVSPRHPERKSLRGKGQRKKKVGSQTGSGVLGSRHPSGPGTAASAHRTQLGAAPTEAPRRPCWSPRSSPACKSRLWGD